MKHTRKKKQSLSSLSLLAFFAIVGLSAIVPSLFNKTAPFLPLIFFLGFLLVTGSIILIWRIDTHRRAKLRALELSHIDNMSGEAFEHYLSSLLKSQGYHVNYTARTGDFGVDLHAQKNGRSYAIQAKCYSKPVGEKAIQEVAAGRIHYKADKAIAITNRTFTRHAQALAATTGVRLVDRETLAEWILIFQNSDTKRVFSLDTNRE